MPRRLLIVQHTPSPAVQEMLEAVIKGANHPEVQGVAVEVRAALSAGPADVLEADGIVLGTPANIGYMSGAMKHFLDQVYYPCLEVTVGLPYGVYVHGNDDTSGAIRALHKIAGGMQWKQVAEDVSLVGAPTKEGLNACQELGALLALQVAGY
ncbi:MAG TPA: NAD(P)H-dependent oxidoreductase [Actinomycetes bacterium]|nr:NAD(P)H-dependent oxidoreductase [Actinomycetes bacterium]